MNVFSENLKFLRKKRGVSQSEVSDYLGLTRNTVSDYENKRSQPSLDNLLRISEFYGVEVSDLLKTKLENAHLNAKSTTGVKDSECTPKCTPKCTPNYPVSEINHTIVSEPLNPMMNKEPDTEKVALREVIDVQKRLIESLEAQIDLLRSR